MKGDPANPYATITVDQSTVEKSGGWGEGLYSAVPTSTPPDGIYYALVEEYDSGQGTVIVSYDTFITSATPDTVEYVVDPPAIYLSKAFTRKFSYDRKRFYASIEGSAQVSYTYRNG